MQRDGVELRRASSETQTLIVRDPACEQTVSLTERLVLFLQNYH